MIRQYQDGDREQCRALWRELTEHHRIIYDDPRIGGEHPEDYFDKQLKKVGPENLWVAEDEEVIGLTGLEPRQEGFAIEPLIVSKPHRGKGIGRALVERMLAEARERGAKFLSMEPVARNVETIAFMHRMGFTQLGQVELLVFFGDLKWRPGFEMHGLEFEY